MDINTALERMRQLVIAARQCAPDDRGKMADLLTDMSVVWDAIDGWLSMGGFKPTEWDHS